MLDIHDGLPLHVVAGIDLESGIVRIITVYVPDRDLWAPDYKTRKTT